MEFIIDNKKNISAFTALKIRQICDCMRIRRARFSLIILVIIDICFFYLNIQQGLFWLGVILLEIAYGIAMDIKLGRKYVYNFDGQKVSANDESFTIGDNTYTYSLISRIMNVDDFVIIFLEKYKIIMGVTDENSDNIQRLLDSIKLKMHKLEEKIVVTNPKNVKLTTKIKAWKNISRYTKYVIGFIRDILLLTIVISLFEMKFFDGVIWIGIVLGIYSVLFAVNVIISEVQISKYLGINVYFTDEYIEWLEKRIEYKDINKVIIKKDYIVINTKKESVFITCTQDNTEQIAKVYDILQFRCSYIANFRDIKECRKHRIIQICGYALIIGCISIAEIILIIKYPSTLSSYKDKFKEEYGIALSVLKEETDRGDYTFEKPYNRAVILDAIKNTEKVLDRFPIEFWDKLSETITLNFIICDDIEPNFNIGVSTSGLTSNMTSKINVYIDSGVYDADETAAHEMFHVMIYALINIDDTNNNLDDIIDGDKWIKCNPDEFVYGKNTSKYKEYFVSDYAKYNMSEDMAETFKYLIACDDKLPDEYESEYIRNKAKYLIEWIEDNFEGVTEDAYWYKWFK